MENSILLFLFLINRYISDAIKTDVLVPKCIVCEAEDSLGRKDGQFYCNNCGNSVGFIHAAKYEQDVKILLEYPEIYETFKEARQSFIDMGHGVAKH